MPKSENGEQESEVRDTEKDNGGGDSFSARVIAEISKNAGLFHDQDSQGYALINREGYPEVLRIRSDEFANYVAYIAWTKLERPLIAVNKQTVITTLEAMARFEGKEYELSVRVARQGNDFWYDLGRKAVKITDSGWEVVEKTPILFKRFPHQEKQVEPVHGGDIKEILKYMNVPTKGADGKHMPILILTYLVSVLIPDIPRPILAVSGLPGAAKSTFFKVIKSIVDPSTLDTMTYPRNSHELIQMLSHHFLICFDNLSELDVWQSDELCKSVTGHAFSKRELYTDDNDVMYHFKRAIGINGVNLVATKSDLLDRSLIFELQPIAKDNRLNEEAFWQEFEKEKPKILGAIFSALSKAMDLRKRGLVVLEKKPRLADYAMWASAASLALGCTIGDFIRAYGDNIEKQNDEAIDSSPIAQAIIHHMTIFEEGREDRQSSKSLFDTLKDHAEDLGLNKDKEFPKTPAWLWRKIKPIKGNLQNIGIEVEYFGNVRPREISLKKVAKENDGGAGHDGDTPENQGQETVSKDSMTGGTAKIGQHHLNFGGEELDPKDVGITDWKEYYDQKRRLKKEIKQSRGTGTDYGSLKGKI